MPRTAVILFNLGGPDSVEAIRPFLLNFFTDPNIIRLPKPFRWCIAQLIAARRSKKEAGTSYGLLGNKSPLLENTQAQAVALEKQLMTSMPDLQAKVFVCMRYWHPMADEVVRQVKIYNPDEIVLLPLYPQYSTTTTRSSLQEWQKAAQEQKLTTRVSMICCYPFGEGFIEASANLVRKAIEAAPAGTRILFSAHGLPESIIKEGDPYQWQCQETAARIMEKTGLTEADWEICYQSRVGPKKWIGPSTDEALHKAAKDKVSGVLVYPHAFVNEHVETLVEIEVEYRELAHELGIPWFGRIETVGTHSRFIEGLANMVKDTVGTGRLASDKKERLCPNKFGQCCMAEFSQGI